MSNNQDVTAMVLTDDKVLLRFWYDSAENAVVSAQNGRPIFDTVLMVDLVAPAQNASTPRIELERVWSPESLAFYGWEEGTTKQYPEYQRYAKYIEDFKRNHTQMELGGTPLKEWPRITKGLVATLAAINVHTVEQVAAIPDANLEVLGMGGRELRDQAVAFLQQAAGSADTSKLVAEVASLRSTVQRLESELVMANQALAAQEAGKASAKVAKPATLPDIGAPSALTV